MLHIAPRDVQLSAYMRKVDQILAEAYALRDKLSNQLASVEKSISAFEQMKKDIPEDDLDRILGRAQNPSEAPLPVPKRLGVADEAAPTTPVEIVVLAQQELLSAGRPMKRGALARALEKRGVRLAGKDKNKNLGTILWRQHNTFVSLPNNLGYWVKGVPLEGVYDPEQFEREEEEAAYSKYRETRFEMDQIQTDHSMRSSGRRIVLKTAMNHFEDRYPSFPDRWLADPFR